MQELFWLANTVVAAPLVGAVISGVGLKFLSRIVTHWLTTTLVALSFFCSLAILIGYINGRYATYDHNLYTWAQAGNLTLTVGFLIDRLSAVMITVVTFVSWMVHIYSIGYMADDPGYKRFFCYISLFTFAMLMLVMANNFMQLFFGWEGVGLVSYLLIGFWFKKSSAIFANLKAFLVNRVGDFGYLLGIAVIFYYFNTLHYADVFTQIKPATPTTLICILLFIGAMAKSAQIPLHVWLPDSMEGPTPISALIHAATMVTAGVYMVARMSPLFENSVLVLSLITIIGAATCFFMGILGVVQKDIKRIVAYSTLSQLGYMVVALGISAYSAAIFHLVTHAFFKALLFLGAGSAIIAMHHDQDIFNMGNLRKYMPITFVTMLIGSLALIGFPGTAGFYSKDLIIEAAKYSSAPAGEIAYYATLFSVFVTALYTFRLIFLVFFTNERMGNSVREHLHECKPVVTWPLIALAVPSVLVGMFMINGILHDFFADSIKVLPQNNVLAEFAQQQYTGPFSMLLHGFISMPFLLMLLGVATAWLCYVKYPNIPSVLTKRAYIVRTILINKYGFDLLYEKIIMPCVRWCGYGLWKIADVLLIDRLVVNGTAYSIAGVARYLRVLQSGYLYHYVFTMIAGLLVLLLYLFYG